MLSRSCLRRPFVVVKCTAQGSHMVGPMRFCFGMLAACSCFVRADWFQAHPAARTRKGQQEHTHAHAHALSVRTEPLVVELLTLTVPRKVLGKCLASAWRSGAPTVTFHFAAAAAAAHTTSCDGPQEDCAGYMLVGHGPGWQGASSAA